MTEINNKSNEEKIDDLDLIKQYKVLTEISPDCIKLFDISGNILYINPAGLKEHGFKNLKEALGAKWRAEDTVIEEDQIKFKRVLEDAAKGKVSTIEITHTPEGSNRRACLETVAPVLGVENKIMGIFGVSRDISGIKKTEKELRDIKQNLELKIEERIKELKRNEEKFRAIATSTTDLIWEGDTKTDSLIWYGDIDKKLGYKQGEFPRTISGHMEQIHSSDLPKFMKSVEIALKEGKEFKGEYRIRNKKGAYFFWEETANPIEFEKGKAVRWVGAVTDITRRKEAEQKLQEKMKELERVNRVMVGRELKMIELKKTIQEYQNENK